MGRLNCILILQLTILAATLACKGKSRDESGEAWRIGPNLLHTDDFASLDRWFTELEEPGEVTPTGDGALEIDVPAGCTVWFRPKLEGPIAIEYDATVIQQGGPNDRVSDLNCFWMACDPRSPDDFFKSRRSGKFADYNQLLAYYVGVGGNSNTTTRFRRYIGDRELRPLLPVHDLQQQADLLEGNRTYHIRIIANGSLIQFWRDDRRLFEYHDSKPYLTGHFGFRTVSSHLTIRHFRVSRLAAS